MQDISSEIMAAAKAVVTKLWSQELIPFKLNIGKITKGSNDYTVNFYDSRRQSVKVLLTEADAFRHLFRAAVLDRVAKMSGPLK
jgi:hypothetical protein